MTRECLCGTFNAHTQGAANEKVFRPRFSHLRVRRHRRRVRDTRATASQFHGTAKQCDGCQSGEIEMGGAKFPRRTRGRGEHRRGPFARDGGYAVHCRGPSHRQ